MIGRRWSLHVRQVHQVSRAGQYEGDDTSAAVAGLPCCLAPRGGLRRLSPAAAETRQPENPEDGDPAADTRGAGERGSGRGD